MIAIAERAHATGARATDAPTTMGAHPSARVRVTQRRSC